MTDIFALSPEDRSKIKILISRPQQAFAITKDTYFDMDTRYASLEPVSKGLKNISESTLQIDLSFLPQTILVFFRSVA